VNQEGVGEGHYATCGAKATQRGSVSDGSIKHVTMEHVWNRIINLTIVLEVLSAFYLPTMVLVGLGVAQAWYNWTMPTNNEKGGGPRIFACLASARNYFSGAHRDKDFFYCAFTVMAKGKAIKQGKKASTYPKGLPVAHYFCFPEYGLAVAMRPGDVLWFNPLHYHCCSQKTQAYDDTDVYVSSWYLKTAVVAGNSNKIELTNEELDIAHKFSIIPDRPMKNRKKASKDQLPDDAPPSKLRRSTRHASQAPGQEQLTFY